jgi:ferritin-like protein
MLQIAPEYLDAVRGAQDATDLHDLLRSAIRLEHATIPPYLVAAYSLNSDVNAEIREAILVVAKEEMLHMAITANLLIAIGGPVVFDDPAFIPKYPDLLPMSVGSGLKVGLRKFSRELVRDVFMKIEEPEDPIHFPGPPQIAGDLTFATIGEFYRAMIDRIKELGNGIFTGDPARQVTMEAGFPSDQLFAVTDVDTAVRALRWIVDEGEGTTTLPFDLGGELAHYYRYEEIYRGRRLIEDPTVPLGFSFTGAEIPFDPAKVWDIPDNPKTEDYVTDSPEHRKVVRFNKAYSNMLRALQRAFNGDPQEIGVAISLMSLVRNFADDLAATTDPSTGKQLGLTFEYVAP